jgi:hypothetical protein
MDLIELFLALTDTAKLRVLTAPSGSATRMAMVAVPVVASSGVSVSVRVAPAAGEHHAVGGEHRGSRRPRRSPSNYRAGLAVVER